jgi:hypothetical protein
MNLDAADIETLEQIAADFVRTRPNHTMDEGRVYARERDPVGTQIMLKNLRGGFADRRVDWNLKEKARKAQRPARTPRQMNRPL